MKDRLNIMLVDDNELDLFLYKRFIEVANIAGRIQTFESAGQALDYLRNFPDNWPDVVIIDIHMPLLDGFEFMETYHRFPEKNLKGTLLYMISTTLDQSDTARVEQDSLVTMLLNKPLDVDLLMKDLIRRGKIRPVT